MWRASLRVGLLGAVVACSGAPRAPVSPPVRDVLALPRELEAPGATILIGDLHGTRELPGFVAQLVGQLAATRPVVLALEILPSELPSAGAYLAGDGGRAARDAALRDPWWRAEYQDGRRSVAMFEMIDRVRALRAGGARVELACFDAMIADPSIAAGAGAREDGMTRNVLAIRAAHPGATLVVYAGNLHTRRAPAAFAPDRAWMAMQLAAAGLAFVTLDPHYADGSSWNCNDAVAAHCGPRSAAGAGGDRGIHLERSADGAYDGWVGLGPITASPPAAFPTLAVGLDARLAALRDSPDARRAGSRRAYRARDYARCVDELDRITGDVANASDAYNQACCRARMGDKDGAFERLQVALERGFHDLDAMAADDDLAALHDDPRWPPRPAH
ncbi:MAG TPA: hypothetical protein VHT91_15495 [Kofleriaceae bacterium]|nr:hypothetical protein [Kofleriaceae bacterium]